MPREYHFEIMDQDPQNQLLQCLEQGSFKGNISLLYTRKPRALDSFLKEGRILRVYGCFKENQLQGFGAAAVNRLWLAGEPQDTAYLFSFRVNVTGARALAELPRGYGLHFREMETLGVKSCFTTILEENGPAIAMLEKNRRSMPEYHYLGRVMTLSRRTTRAPRLPIGWSFCQAKPEDWPELLQFLEEQGRSMDYFPLLSMDDLKTGLTSPKGEDFYLLRNAQEKILAAGAAWDQRSYKQYIPVAYGGIMKALNPLSSWLFPLFGFPPLPDLNEAMNFYLLSCWAVAENNPKWFRVFMRQMAAIRRRSSFFSLSIHEGHPLYAEACRGPVIGYGSRFYEVLPRNGKALEHNRPIYIEPGRL